MHAVRRVLGPATIKILIAVDNPDLAGSLGLGFELHWSECQVVAAEDGEQALAAFFRESPDVVLLDIGMPRLDGFEVLRRIRAVSDAPVVMLTVKGEELDVVRALELGADDYITTTAPEAQSPKERCARCPGRINM